MRNFSKFALSAFVAAALGLISPLSQGAEGDSEQDQAAASQDSNRDGQRQQNHRRRNTSSLDRDRANLRQSLRRDQANDAQRQAILNRIPVESEVDKQRRQRAYEANARLRGEEAIMMQDLGPSPRANSDWTEEEELSYEEVRRQRLAQIEQRRLATARGAAIKSWASGETDVEEVRRQAREKAVEDRRRAQEERRRQD